jgi:hypothetical protein
MPIDPTTVLYSPDDSAFHDQTYVPTDATRSFSARYNVPIQAALDNAAWLRARMVDPLPVPLFGAQQTDYASASSLIIPAPHRFAPWPAAPSDPPATIFERAGWLQFDASESGGLWWYIPIRMPTNITMVAASLNGSDGPGTNPGFPGAAERPKMRLYRQPVDGSARELLLTLSDETSSQGQYETHHTIPLNPAILFDPVLALSAGEYLIIEFAGHKGLNVDDNTLKLYGIKISTELA